MDIDRHVNQKDTAEERVEFCLDQLEAATGFAKGMSWETDIIRGVAKRLTLEEVIGALVSAGQYIKEKKLDETLE